MNRCAVVLAGGSGERFWPLSRRNRPKQFLKLADTEPTLLNQAIARLKLFLPSERIYIATGQHLGPITRRECPAVPPENILLEPEKRNTSGAIGWAMTQLPGDAAIGFFPADHAISDLEAFASTAESAFQVAELEDALVVIGITPTRPETGYGYIEAAPSSGISRDVLRFHEKPEAAKAEEYVRDGGFYWNAGMFFWTASSFWRELREAAPTYADTLESIGSSLQSADCEGAERLFASLPSISIDHLVMEKARRIKVVPAGFDWDDIGSLDALARWLPADSDGNSHRGSALAIDAHNNLIVSEDDGVVCVLGVEDLVVIRTADATLVCDRRLSQEVRRIVQELEKTRPELT